MKRIIAIYIISNLMLAPAEFAQDRPVFDTDAFIKSAGVKTALEIGIVDCVAMALKKNSEILVKKISPLIEDANVKIEKAKFEPDLTFDFTMEDNTDLSSNTLIGTNTTKTRTGTFNFGYGQKLVTGTDIAVDFFNTRTRSNSRIQSMNPQFDSKAGITVTQPLLKGFGITVNKADLLIAKNNRKKSAHEFAQDVIGILTDVKKTYYDFQYAREQYRVAEVSLKRVQGLHDINKERYSKGLASNVDLLQSEAEMSRFEEALYESEREMKLAEDKLKLITNLVNDAELWNSDIEPLDSVSYEAEEVPLVEALQEAFKVRPDYEAAKIDLKNKDISVIYYRNGMLPIVDLSGSYGLNGLGKNYEKDMGHLGKARYPDWSVGVSVKLPLGSDEEKGKYEKSKLEKAQALEAFKRLEQTIILEVRDAVRNVEITYKMLGASIKARDAQRSNYEAQETRFREGLVSTHDIVDYQERLALAEIGYIKSVIDYNTAQIELAKAQGTTLIEDKIKIE